MKVVIVRGISGSGKSTLAEQILKNSYSGVIISADEYWVRPDGYYDFNMNVLGKAHQWCFDYFKQCVGNEYGWDFDVVVLDNTNTTRKEFAKYIEFAVLNFCTEISILEPDTQWKYDVEECYRRNTHNVPRETIQKMLDRFQSTKNILDHYATTYGGVIRGNSVIL